MADRWNEIYVGGVLLDDVVSGDVSALEQQLREAIENGDEWVSVTTGPTTHYNLHVSPATDIVVRYRQG
ncbi:hypothetical protein BJK06_11195 [Curtobacterium sp. BH-2-1-1]|uniref:hypothetical protein n=1 Tax=Curtobacterium sp. BH-2-1-1 TaxID=1905847 RepID=UPI00089DF40A|nr:hypothetical protein [Curtobacterium sp. BH-2-1-1]AOX66245.1 hypothetical protein BJK06_11195 [Curtobacterium sp. BH-2-1-1]